MWKCVGGYLGMLFEWFMFVGGCVVCGLCYVSGLYSVLGWVTYLWVL